MSLLAVCWESHGSLLGVCWESAGSLLGFCWESDRSLLTGDFFELFEKKIILNRYPLEGYAYIKSIPIVPCSKLTMF